MAECSYLCCYEHLARCPARDDSDIAEANVTIETCSTCGMSTCGPHRHDRVGSPSICDWQAALRGAAAILDPWPRVDQALRDGDPLWISGDHFMPLPRGGVVSGSGTYARLAPSGYIIPLDDRGLAILGDAVRRANGEVDPG